MIKDCPFFDYTPTLIIKIINPHARPVKSLTTNGIIDTGASECTIPAAFAPLLGHNLKNGVLKSNVQTASGATNSWAHTTTFEIFHPITRDFLCRIENIPVDFMEKLPVVLLGASNFLGRFILNINYPLKKFSLLKGA